MKPQRKKKTVKKIMAGLLSVCMLLTGIGAAVFADVLSDLEEQKNDLQAQQKELEEKSQQLNEQLEKLKDDQSKQQEYYDSLEEQIEVVMDQIDTANERLEQLDAGIQEKQEEISGAQTQLDGDFEQLKERLCALYKMGNAGTLEILLSAENLPDLMRKTEMMSAVTRHDTQLMDSIREQMQGMSEQKAQLEADRDEAASLREQLEEKRQELTSLQQESARVLEELGKTEEQLSQEISDADQQKEQLLEQLSEIQKQWLAEKNKPTPTPEPTPDPEPDPDPEPEPTSPPSSTGYTWPVPGFPKVGDGWYEGGRAHKGIDIIGAGIYGQPIVAAQSGQVLTAYTADEWGFGWGYHVMIGHDDGYATQYAHMSRVAVSTGQYVKKGQIIGYVGNTGDSYGAHLHFELWENGERINPEIVLPYR